MTTRKVLLLSTYELGAQPLGLAQTSALARAAGHLVRPRDLSLEALREDDVAWADAVVFAVPMHTALRLALACLEQIRALRPALAVALVGLYAPVGLQAGALTRQDLSLAGDDLQPLLDWLATDSAPTEGSGPSEIVALSPPRRARRGGEPRVLPDRRDLPPLSRYARYIAGERECLVGSLETTAGCNHRCRHCPVPVIFDGRSRALEIDDVLADVEQLVGLGAGHLHFGDADFLNRPAHALAVARALHASWPSLSFDATIKVSHILRHAELFADLASCGLSFVISAFESTSERVLAALDKGHHVQDEVRALAICRAAGVEIRPSLLPFTPWTTRADLVELVDFVAREDLVFNVDTVQYAIRLLLPSGSLLLSSNDETLARALVGYDAAELGYRWRAADPLLDELAANLAQVTEACALAEAPADDAYREVRAAIFAALGEHDPGAPVGHASALAGPLRPRLSEAWFCCAEPTSAQLQTLRARGSDVACCDD